MALTPKQQAFVNEYLQCWNATRAAQRAGYQGNDNVLAVTGHDLLRNPKIDEIIKRRLSESAMPADEVLMRLAEQARAAQSAYLTPQGVDLQRLIADGKGHLVKGIKETAYGRNIEFYDAQAALVQLGKHHKLFTEQVQHSGNVNSTDIAVYLPDNGRNDRD